MRAKKKEIIDDKNQKVQNLDDLIKALLSLIDQIDSCFREAKALILELATRLDEEGVYERGYICREIKKILKDKISQGKITEKWIEECLPKEYKRRYSKSELSSLSKQKAVEDLSDQQLIHLDATGKELIEDSQIGEDARHSDKSHGLAKDKFLGETNGQEIENDYDIQGCTFLIGNSELKIQGSEIMFTILREKYEEVINAMRSSRDLIQITFDQLGPFIRAEPDVFEGL